MKLALREVSPTCGDCSGFECEILIEGKKHPCSKLDKTKVSKPCQQFAPNVKPVGTLGENSLGALADLIHGMDSGVLRALSVIMHNEPKTRKQKMKFMQPVYVRYRGQTNRNYISNFMKAYVMYATPQHIKLMSRDGRCVLTYNAGARPAIFTEEEFADLYAKMLKKGSLVDPDTEQMIVRRFRWEEEYELNLIDKENDTKVSSIDAVFTGNKIKKGRMKGQLPDLVSLVDKAAAGFNVDKESRVYDIDDTKARKRKRGGGGDYSINVSAGGEDE